MMSFEIYSILYVRKLIIGQLFFSQSVILLSSW